MTSFKYEKDGQKRYLYFAYGSNLNLAQMRYRCPGSRPMFKAILYNAQLVFKYYCDVVRLWDKRAFVMGAVYEITEEDLKELDRYEGYPVNYKRVKCVVRDPRKQYHEAFMYVMTDKNRPVELPSHEYLSIVTQGYQDWGLPTTTLCNAWERAAIKLGVVDRIEDKKLKKLKRKG